MLPLAVRELFARRLRRYLFDTQEARLLTADIGYGVLDAIRSEQRHQCVDFGAAEQLMIGAACGMALSGLKPICYSITPFLLYRPFEWIRNFVNHDRIPVKLVGVGRGRDYGSLGFTHWAEDEAEVIKLLPNVKRFSEVSEFEGFLQCDGPAYLNLRK